MFENDSNSFYSVSQTAINPISVSTMTTMASVFNSTNSTINMSKVEIILFSMIFTIIGVVGVLGNSLVILAVACDSKMRRSAMNVLLLNLAIADLCNLIFCIPEIALAIMQQGWMLPWLTCPVLRYLEVLFLYTSLLTQVAVCIERFFAIAIPMKIKLFCSRKKVQLWALVLWMIALLFATPVLISSKKVPTSTFDSCRPIMDPLLLMVFKISECLMFYFLPLIVIVVLYTRISLILWSTNARLHEGCHSNDRNTVNETLRTRQNVVKMLIGCIFVYFVCYSPLQALFIASFIGHTFVPPFSVRLILNCMAYGCSAANPLLYSVFSRKFRTKFSEILKCTSSKDRHTTTVYVPSMSRYLAVSAELDGVDGERIKTTTRLMARMNSVNDCGSLGTTI